MKISFIVTVFNEEKTIKGFFESLIKQTKKPDEIIVVDGGSTDGTVKIIKNYELKIDKKEIKFKYYIKKGNRSVGRNEAIKRASGNIIACSDAGNILNKNWLERIVEPFKNKNVDVVAGFYHPTYKSIVGKCIACFTCVAEDRVTNDFLPSSRSIAFRKSTWVKVKGYPENLDTCEDLVFARNLKSAGMTFKIEKRAFVKWRQVENFSSFFKQLFLYAKGDGEASYIRANVLLLFGRYILGLYLLFLLFLYQITDGLLAILFVLGSYVTWSVFKNYYYVKKKKAILILPALQFLADFAVLIGTSYGLIRQLNKKNFYLYIRKNKYLFLIICVYIFLELYFIGWGAPNQNHPFPYHMDEWHQLNAVRSTFAYGTPNVAGSANGTMFHFLVSGLYLIPFSLVGWINLVNIEISDFTNRMRIFDLLRLNTIFFGTLSIFALYKIVDILKGSKEVAITLFTFTPIWLLLSGYFKYDIALIFWILLSILIMLRFAKKPSNRNFLLAAIPTALAVAVKISAIPLLPIYVVSFFIFGNWKKNIKSLIMGILLFGFIVLLFGAPDTLFGKGDIVDYLYNNIFTTPALSSNYILNASPYTYLYTKHYPIIFGYGLSILFILSLGFPLITLLKNGLIKSIKKEKIYYFILLSLSIFIISLLPLKLLAGGNRSLVLLPFFVLLVAYSYKKAELVISKRILIPIVMLAVLIQSYQSFAWLYVKYSKSPQESASSWIEDNIPKNSIIGIENIPIYQMEPNIIQQEFYFKEYGIKNNEYDYEIITGHNKVYPEYLVITNRKMEVDLLETSPKKELLNNIPHDYLEIATFEPNTSFLRVFANRRDFYLSGSLVASPNTISVYKKIVD